MSKIQRETVAERTTAALRQSILLSTIPQGAAVTEEAMAEEFGVSRPTVRQALSALQLEGLLTRHPTTRVLQVTTLDSEDVRELYRGRRFLELGGVDAARDATPDQLQKLRDALQDLRDSVLLNNDLHAFVEADFRCHSAIVAFLGSRQLSETHAQLMSQLRIVIAHVTMDKHDNLESLSTHEEFAQQILSGHFAEARLSLSQRLKESEQNVLSITDARAAAHH